jgi:two-component system phosphate regulon sensor histidine kinase PhoR
MSTKQQTKNFEQTSRVLSEVLATMREGVIIVNARKEIVHYNDAARRILKLPPRKSAVMTALEYRPTKAATKHAPLARQLKLYKPDAEPEIRLRLVDAARDPEINNAFQQTLSQRSAVDLRAELIGQNTRSYQIHISPLGDDLAVGFFSDITQLERLERIRREFFANLSHELRTPLTSILAYAETLLDGAIDDPENRARFIKKLHKQAVRMSELIADISDLSAIESGSMNLLIGTVRLQSLISDVIVLTEALRTNCDVSISTHVPEDLVVQADRTRLEQILYNLINNAIKFNRKGGSVKVTATEQCGIVTIDIEDTGIGIAEADRSRIFERLYRGDKSRSRKIEGTGLGLAIVKHLVRAHGGTISVKSQVGTGSCFSFSIPVGSARLNLPPFQNTGVEASSMPRSAVDV